MDYFWDKKKYKKKQISNKVGEEAYSPSVVWNIIVENVVGYKLLDYGHLHQYSRWNMQRTHIIMNFSKVGLLKIPFSGPDMWNFAKSYHIRKFSQISFKWAMVSSISLTIEKYFSQSFLKQELYRSNLFKTTKLMISIPCIVILI